MLYQSTCVGLGYGLYAGAISWKCSKSRDNPISPDNISSFVTSSRPRNINLVPIDYAFRPRLRGRLTLRGLTLRRNPWTFGDSVSHTVYRYSCQHSHFRYLQQGSPHLPSQAYGTLRYRIKTATSLTPAASVHGLSPVTFSAQDFY